MAKKKGKNGLSSWSEYSVILVDADAPRDLWLLARRQGVGASETAKVCGISRWGTALQVWRDKTSTEPPSDEPPSESAKWGHLHEPVIADVYAQENSLVLDHVGLLQSVKWPWMLATPDRAVAGARELVEIKTTDKEFYKDWANGQTPDDAEMQAQKQLAVTGYNAVHVVALIGGSHMESRYITRDQELIDHITEIERKFWHDHVLTKTAPPATALDTATVADMYPQPDPNTVVELPTEAFYLISEYKEARTEEKNAAARKDQAGNRLKQMLGHHEIGKLHGDFAVSWKAATTSKLDQKLLRDQQPQLFDQYVTERVERRIYLGKA